MALSSISGVRLTGLVSAVPANAVSIDAEAHLFGGNTQQIERIKTTVGLDKRRVAPHGLTACDMAERAVRSLLKATATDPASIDGIFMVTQTPDFLQPGNAVLLQDRAGLPQTCVAMDINQGCAGFIHGLWATHSFIAGGNLRRVILVVGDTISRIISPEDRSLRPLFGDAACAVLLESDPEAADTHFHMQTDGSGHQALWQPGGGFREPVSDESTEVHQEGEGIRRSRCHLHMDGAEIFNFSLKVGPQSIAEVLQESGWDVESVDGFVLHQANRYIIENIRRRMKLPPERVPSGTVEKYGNQSSASIPVTLTDHYGEQLTRQSHRMVLCGFGVGLSWGSCAIELPALKCNRLLQVELNDQPASSTK